MTAALATLAIADAPLSETGPARRTGGRRVGTDATLLELSARLQTYHAAASPLTLLTPAEWDGFHQEAAAARVLVDAIAETPATGRVGLRAKARALQALLDGGDGQLYPDAAAPDTLAWSLVHDILES